MNSYINTLNRHHAYEKRKVESTHRIKILKEELKGHPFIVGKNICIYIAGSIARNEYGEKSDIDLFIVSEERIKKIEEYAIYAALIEINQKLGYPEFSNDARYLRVYPIADLITATGSPRDDNENLFTARQLLLLESKCLYNEPLYQKIITEILRHYFNDFDGQEDFKPIFLLNDILRYWRTLCLNYEQIRHDKNRPWRKKNINLKFSRKITIFSTVIAIISDHSACFEFMETNCNLAPFERLANALDKLNNSEYLNDFEKFIDLYEIFIAAKENEEVEKDKSLKQNLDNNATWITNFFHKIIHDKNIDNEMKMYLIQ